MVRTRSSYFLDTLCKNYKITNQFEFYSDARPENEKKSFFKDNTSLFNNYKKIILSYTERLHKNTDFGIKLFPTIGLNYSKFSTSPTPDFLLEKSDFLDLETYFQISKYDQIFLLHRNDIVNCLASFFHAQNITIQVDERTSKNGALFSEEHRNLINFYKPKNKLVYNKHTLMLAVYEFLCLQIYEKYLISNNITYNKLEYSDIPNYIKNNFSGIDSDLIETHYDYSQFSNYKKFESDVLECLDYLKTQIDFNLFE